jgi:hypothetical protein
VFWRKLAFSLFPHVWFENREVDYFYIVMAGGDVFDRIIDMNTHTEKDARDLAKLLLEAVEYLHRQNCGNCGLQPPTSEVRNFLIKVRFRPDDSQNDPDDMLSLLHRRKEDQSPLAFGSTTKNAFIQIAQILRRATHLPFPSPLTPVPEPRVVQAPPITATIPSVTGPRVVAPPSPPQPVLPTPPPTALTTKPQPTTRPTTRALRPIPSRARLPTLQLARHAPGPTRYSAQAVFRHKYAHHIAALATTPIAGKQASLPKLLRGPEAATWSPSNANEWGRLLEFGTGRDRPIADQITGIGTIFFIRKADVPSDRHVSSANYVCNIRPQKAETHRVRMTAGGAQFD